MRPLKDRMEKTKPEQVKQLYWWFKYGPDTEYNILEKSGAEFRELYWKCVLGHDGRSPSHLSSEVCLPVLQSLGGIQLVAGA